MKLDWLHNVLGWVGDSLSTWRSFWPCPGSISVWIINWSFIFFYSCICTTDLKICDFCSSVLIISTLLKINCHDNKWGWVFVGHKGRLYFVPFEPWWTRSQVSLLLGLKVSGVPHEGCLSPRSVSWLQTAMCVPTGILQFCSQGGMKWELLSFISISCKVLVRVHKRYNVVMTKSE